MGVTLPIYWVRFYYFGRNFLSTLFIGQSIWAKEVKLCVSYDSSTIFWNHFVHFLDNTSWCFSQIQKFEIRREITSQYEGFCFGFYLLFICKRSICRNFYDENFYRLKRRRPRKTNKRWNQIRYYNNLPKCSGCLRSNLGFKLSSCNPDLFANDCWI